MLLLILLLPLLNTICCGILGFFIGTKGVRLVSLICLSLTFFYSLFLFFQIALTGDIIILHINTWFNNGLFFLNWGLLYDSVTSIMFLVVTFISLLVHCYSLGYMDHDAHLPRFMSYLSLFTFFMLILVSANNFVQLFVGWEGVGLCSYLLISFWYTRIQANKAAIKALIVNRIGDFSIIVGLCFLFKVFNSLNYSLIFAITPHLFLNTFITIFNIEFLLLNVICFFF